MTEPFKIYDPNLDALVKKFSSSFGAFQTNLDQTSSDIKNLEKWLQNNGICFYCSVSFDVGEALAWSNSTGEWRLTHEELDGSYSGDPEINPTALIEMPVRTRLKAKQHLPRLLSAIAELVPQNEPEVKKKPLNLFTSSSATPKVKRSVELEEALDASLEK